MRTLPCGSSGCALSAAIAAPASAGRLPIQSSSASSDIATGFHLVRFID